VLGKSTENGGEAMPERQNRWVATREQIKDAEARYASPKDSGLVARSVQHFYETDPGIVAALLPPPLAPGDRPEVWVSIGRMPDIDLGVAQVAVACRYGEEDGWYCLHLPMTAEAAVVGGRERFGENKKIADIGFTRDGDHIEASVTRYGITYLEFVGDAVERVDAPATEVVPHYYFKYSLAADGNGYDHEPVLVRSVHTRKPKGVERVEGKLVLRDSKCDPVSDLAVERDVRTIYTERTAFIAAKAVERVDGDAFLPFVYQRYDFPGQG
jgi:acetoacetate decarboxylase